MMAWTEKVRENAGKPEYEFYRKAPVSLKDGITFNEGILEDNIQSKLLINKEKNLRNKFLKEFEEKEKNKKFNPNEINE